MARASETASHGLQLAPCQGGGHCDSAAGSSQLHAPSGGVCLAWDDAQASSANAANTVGRDGTTLANKASRLGRANGRCRLPAPVYGGGHFESVPVSGISAHQGHPSLVTSRQGKLPSWSSEGHPVTMGSPPGVTPLPRSERGLGDPGDPSCTKVLRKKELPSATTRRSSDTRGHRHPGYRVGR